MFRLFSGENRAVQTLIGSFITEIDVSVTMQGEIKTKEKEILLWFAIRNEKYIIIDDDATICPQEKYLIKKAGKHLDVYIRKKNWYFFCSKYLPLKLASARVALDQDHWEHNDWALVDESQERFSPPNGKQLAVYL